MEQQNYITIEMNFKFQMKDYRLVLGVKKIGIVFVLTLIAHVMKLLWGQGAS